LHRPHVLAIERGSATSVHALGGCPRGIAAARLLAGLCGRRLWVLAAVFGKTTPRTGTESGGLGDGFAGRVNHEEGGGAESPGTV
jgi:hypothetical protein